MPRTGRFQVEFTVGDKTFVVGFQHQHDDDGFSYVDALEGKKKVPIKHLTTAHLREKGQSEFVSASAACSIKEAEYKWQIGVEKAFKRTLVKLGWAEEITETKAGNGKILRKGQFVQLRPEYSEAVKNFLREMEIKDYAPHNVAPVNREVPAEMQNGTYHLGAD